MSVLLEQELILGSYLSGDKLVLEPQYESDQNLPFIDSQILNPELFRLGILQLNQILMAHPGVSLNRIYDPIVSVTENYVDFEGFARFGHSYCKIRFPDTLFKGHIRQEGVTNVDFNPNFIRHLRSRYYNQNLWLYIDPNGVELSINNSAHVLKKITMPKWWKDAYKELNTYIDTETLEPELSDDFSKIVLSGNAFQRLVDQLNYNDKLQFEGVRSLFWQDRAVNLVYANRSRDVTSISSVNLITPCNKPIKSWGVWRIQNLSDIAQYIIQADAYIAEKAPSFWVLHARSGVQLLLGFTPYTGALWTEKARKEVEELLKNPYSLNIPPRRSRKKRHNYRKALKVKINFVDSHPGQRVIPDFLIN
jgi:hypothetical protein